MIILGVDPGSQVTGFAIARVLHSKTSIFDYGYLQMSSHDPMPKRIEQFHTFLTEKIKTHHVTHLAIETPFLGKNPQSFIKLGYLRSILYLLSQHHSLILHELAPCQIKQAVTGYGKASKEQVAAALGAMLPMLKSLKGGVREDVTDAIAIALTGIWAENTRQRLI